MSASLARTTGTLELACAGGESATLVFTRGLVEKVRTSAPVAFLGALLYELGVIDPGTMNDSLAELARTKRLHGQILRERGAITEAQLDQALHEQTTRKVMHLFSLPRETAYTFTPDEDRLATWGGKDWPLVDPFVPVWLGIRQGLADEAIAVAMGSVPTAAFRVVPGAALNRVAFSTDEGNAVECLRIAPLTIEKLAAAAAIDARRARQIAYFLLVTRAAEIAPPQDGPHRSQTLRGMPAVTPRHASSGAIPAVIAPPRTASRQMYGASVEARPDRASQSAMQRPDVPAVAPAPSASPPPRRDSKAFARPEPPAPAESGQRRIGSSPGVPASTPSASPPQPPSQPPSQEMIARRQRIAERARTIAEEDFFRRLSLTREASGADVDAAYQALRNLWDATLLPPALDDAREDCQRVLACLTEAHATLRNPFLRGEYVSRLHAAALRTSADRYAEDLKASGAPDAWTGAQALFARGDNERAERLARRASRDDPKNAGALAMVAWLEAQLPPNQGDAPTRARIAVLDKAIDMDAQSGRAYFWRGLLQKRLDNHAAAARDFRRVLELDPKHAQADQELRLAEMRTRKISSPWGKAVR